MSNATAALASLSLCVLMPSLDTSMINAGLPALAARYNVSFRDAQWIVLVYLSAITALVVGAGRLGDAIGRRSLLLTGLSVFTAASLAGSVVSTLTVLLVARLAQGAGAAIMLALGMAFVGDTVPAERTGRAMGLLGSMSAVGTTMGPAVGGVLVWGFGPSALFLVNVPLGLLAFALALRALPAHQPASSSPRPRTGGFIAGAVSLLANRALAAGLVMNGMVSTVMMTTLVVGPVYLGRALGLAAVTMGFVLSVGPLVTGLSGAPAGRVVDRLGAQRSTRLGLMGLACGTAVLSAMPEAAGPAGYVWPIVVMTASYALFQAGNNTAVMNGAKPGQRGLAAGLLQLSRNIGLIAGAAAMGAVFAFGIGGADVLSASAAGVATAARFTFAVALGLIVIGLGIALASRSSTVSHAR